MHTVHREFERTPYSPKFTNFYPQQYNTQGDIPSHEDDVAPSEEPGHKFKSGVFQSSESTQEYDSPHAPELEEDLLNTLIVGKDASKTSKYAKLQEPNLPSEIMDLINSLDNLSQFLSHSHKQYLSHQLTRMSYCLQTDCLYPEDNLLKQPSSPKDSPPPLITPRKSHTLTSRDFPQFPSPSISTDWSGPGSFPEQQRPNQLNVDSSHNQRSASIQFETQHSLVRQLSNETVYANTKSPCVTPIIAQTQTHNSSAPPLPPRDQIGGPVGYQNVPANRRSKNNREY